MLRIFYEPDPRPPAVRVAEILAVDPREVTVITFPDGVIQVNVVNLDSVAPEDAVEVKQTLGAHVVRTEIQR